MSVSEWLRDVAGQWWDAYWREVGKAWDSLLAELNEIWDFRWYEFLVPLVTGGLVGARILRTIDAFREFGEDLRLVPSRVAVEVVDDLIPVPDEWKGRVMTADQALRFCVHEALDFAVNLVDVDLPSEVDVGKAIELSGAVKGAVDEARAVDEPAPLERARRILRGRRFRGATTAVSKAWLVSLLGSVLTVFAASGCVLFAAWVVWKAHQDPEKRFLNERALPQNSRRVYGTRRGQHRENARRGPD